MKALTLIQLCAREYNDVAYERIARDATSATRTNQPNWLDWLNDAQRTTVLVRPDAGSITESVKLVAGTKQTLPANAQLILDVTRNMGGDGLTPGRTIRLVDDEMKSDTNRDWHIAADAGVVRELIYNDKKDPLTFYVSPPAVDKYIELVLCTVPPDIADANVTTADFGLTPLYAGPAQAWMLHRAYGMATNAPGNVDKSWRYFNSFFNQLGVKLRGELFAAAAAMGERVPQAAGRA